MQRSGGCSGMQKKKIELLMYIIANDRERERAIILRPLTTVYTKLMNSGLECVTYGKMYIFILQADTI